jgi:hypothetical protein
MEEDDFFDVSIEVEYRANGRHIIVSGDAPEEVKRSIKYELFSQMNSENYQNLLKTLPKE